MCVFFAKNGSFGTVYIQLRLIRHPQNSALVAHPGYCPSENLNTHPLVRKQVDFLAGKLIFQQLARMGMGK